MSTKVKLHPIQLVNLFVRKMEIIAYDHPDRTTLPDTVDLQLINGHQPYDKESQRIQIDLEITVGKEQNKDLYKWKEGDTPFFIRVVVSGKFQVDESQFPQKDVEKWAGYSGSLVLLPFAREQAYSLATRAGFKTFIFPLIEVPTYRVEAPCQPKPDSGSGEN